MLGFYHFSDLSLKTLYVSCNEGMFQLDALNDFIYLLVKLKMNPFFIFPEILPDHSRHAKS